MANPANIVLGPDVGLVVNGYILAVIEGELSASIPVHETSDSQSAAIDLPAKCNQAGVLGELRGSFTAQRDTTVFLHGPVLDLVEGDTITLAVYPFGVPSGRYYYAAYFVLDGWQSSWKCQDSPIQTIKFSGRSSQAYDLLL